MTAAKFPATFADGKRKSSHTYGELYVWESEEEKWRIRLHENTDALCTNGVSNLRLERRRFVSHRRRHCVTAERYVVFILPWNGITAMSDTGIRSNYTTYPFTAQSRIFIRLIISTLIGRVGAVMTFQLKVLCAPAERRPIKRIVPYHCDQFSIL